VLFPARSEGSLVQDAAGNVVGSSLLAQGFAKAAYFQPRPSAAGDKGWDPTSSGGSNLGPTSKKLQEAAAARLDALGKDNPDAGGPPPVELVTASGSGLDPHLSPAAALWQAPRVARARGVSVERVRAFVDEYTEGRELGILGEPRVNVLELNLAMDRRLGAPAAPSGTASGR
jgi:K+-transporting ATPase ATPase C chain